MSETTQEPGQTVDYRNRIFYRNQGSLRHVSEDRPHDALGLSDDPLKMDIRANHDVFGDATINSATGTPDRVVMQTRLNSMHDNAVYSQNWIDRLETEHSQSPLRRAGRGLLNAIGMKTPTQKAVEVHEGRINQYRTEIGYSDESFDPSVETHVERRDALIDRQFGEALRAYLGQKGESEDELLRTDAQTFISGVEGYEPDKTIAENLSMLSIKNLLAAHDIYMHSKEDMLPSQRNNNRSSSEDDDWVSSKAQNTDRLEALKAENNSKLLDHVQARYERLAYESADVSVQEYYTRLAENHQQWIDLCRKPEVAKSSLDKLLIEGGFDEFLAYRNMQDIFTENGAADKLNDLYVQVLTNRKTYTPVDADAKS